MATSSPTTTSSRETTPTRSLELSIMPAINNASAAYPLLAHPSMPATNESHKVDSDLLDARIQALAQELQDEIFSFAFLQIPRSVSIDKDYKLPMALQLNSSLRDNFAKEYYKNVTFKGENRMIGGQKYRTMSLWNLQLEKQHKNAIRTIEFTLAGSADPQYAFAHGRIFYRTWAHGIHWAATRRPAFSEEFRLLLNFVDEDRKLKNTLEGDQAFYFDTEGPHF